MVTLLLFTFPFFCQFSDFRNYAIHGKLQDNPRLERSIMLFNGLSLWVQCMVLSKSTPQYRAQVITKFVNVAKVRKNNMTLLRNCFLCITMKDMLSYTYISYLKKCNNSFTICNNGHNPNLVLPGLLKNKLFLIDSFILCHLD